MEVHDKICSRSNINGEFKTEHISILDIHTDNGSDSGYRLTDCGTVNFLSLLLKTAHFNIIQAATSQHNSHLIH